MKVIITGVTGMVGEGVLLECLGNGQVTEVLMINRRSYPLKNPKLKELILKDFSEISLHTELINNYDGCFFCAGVSSIGKNEEVFTKMTYDFVIPFARILAESNPAMTFIYVSGTSTDSTENGKIMWARVKGKTENDLMKLGFKQQYNFRPAIMTPTKGQVNVKRIFRILLPVLIPFFRSKTLSLQQVGRAMIHAISKGYTKQVLEVEDIRELAN